MNENDRFSRVWQARALKSFARVGLTVLDAVCVLLTRIVEEGSLPAGLTIDRRTYDEWFRSKVMEALADMRPAIQHRQLMDEIESKAPRRYLEWVWRAAALARRRRAESVVFIPEIV